MVFATKKGTTSEIPNICEALKMEVVSGNKKYYQRVEDHKMQLSKTATTT
jgi:hypothetical protein